MIKILRDLKKDDIQLYNKVLKHLDKYGARVSHGTYNKLRWNDYLDLISFADTYSFQYSEVNMVMDILGDLNPAESKFMADISKNLTPEEETRLRNKLELANNRTRQAIVKFINKYAQAEQDKPSSIVEALAKLKSVVFS